MKSQRVVVVGQGYVGLPVAMLAVARGFEVTGYDVDADRVARLRAGRSFIGDVPDARLQASLQSGLYRVNADEDELRGFDIAVIAVPTPALAGEPDLSYVESAAKALAVHLRPGATVILESTTWPGTTEEVVVPLLETSGLRAGADFAVGYSPERINPGDGLAGMAAVPKVVSGIDAASLQQVAGFWAALVETVVAAPDIRTAEFSKLLENVFRLVNVSLVNELTQHAGALG
ncbi:nucleotide sugar dehydrogenase, partial [Nocardia carnea]|uniref:nucleotide sugar dehydrogenase n=1 Tax=Nocardia carnea TaxID=37328 RepID=UPI00245751BD